MDYPDINSACAGISALLFSVVFVNMQPYIMKGTNGPLGSFDRSGVGVFGLRCAFEYFLRHAED